MNNRLLSERLHLLPFLVRFFSKSKEEISSKLSAGAQKALWAQKIINKIAKADDNLADDITKPSLHQLIVNCQAPIKNVAFEDTHRKDVIDMFESGIHLNRSVFTQGRIDGGQNINSTFTFCPNLLVTRPIFQHLRHPTKYTMFYDAYGISKTVSIIMFIELSRHVHQYIYDAAVDKNLKEEYKMLRSGQYIEQMNKYWYWSINISNELRPGYLQKKIAAQATELSPEKRLEIRNCKTPSEAIRLAKNFYSETNIQHTPVVDQINMLALLMRNWNIYKENNRQNIEGHKDFKTSVVGYNNAVELDKCLKQFLYISDSNGWVLNSPTNLEANLLFGDRYVHQKYDPLSLNLLDKNNKHELEAFKALKFDYLINLQKDWGKNDFWHTCWFQINRNIEKNNTMEALNQLKDCFFDHVKNLQIKQYYCFVEISRFIRNKLHKIEKITQNADKRQQTELMAKFMLEFDQYCFDKCMQRAKEFFLKKGDTDMKKDFQHLMYVITINAKFRGQKELIIDMENINNQLSAKNLNTFEYFQSDDKELIPFQYVNQKTQVVSILWGTELFCNIMERLFLKSFDYRQSIMNQLQDNQVKDKVFFGKYNERLIVSQLKKGSILQLMNANKLRKQNIDNGNKSSVRIKKDITEKSFKKVKYKIASIAYFDAFPLKQEQYESFNFEQSLETVLKQCDKVPDKWVSAIPVVGKKQRNPDEKTQSSNNPNVDFILAKREDRSSGTKYILNCVDVAISKEYVADKETKALRLYKKLLSSSKQDKFQVNHIILCPQNSCIGFLKEENLTVAYSNIEAMRFYNSTLPKTLTQFEGI